MDRAAAAAELAALDADRAALADRVIQPWWWDVTLGLSFFGFVSSYAFHDVRVIAAALVLFFAAFLGLVAAYRRITGVWWDATKVGPVQERVRRALRWWGWGYGVAMLGGAAAEYLLDLRGAMVVVGAVLGVCVAVSSRWVSRVYAAGLRAVR